MFSPISIRTFTFSLCVSAFLQGTLENGFVRLNLLSLEHKFGLATSQLAYILAGYDVATVLFLIPFVYFTGGPHTDKPRYIALGLLFMGAGSAVLSLPQFLVPPEDLYSGDNDTDLCLSGIEPSTSPVPVPESSSGLVVAIFILGQTLVGIGATPLYTLAVTWIDENIPKRKSPLYVGFFYTASILGPAFGYIVGGFVLDNIHTDFLVHHSALTINSSSKLWIGAWWLLFLAAGIACLVIGGFLLLYPKNLTRTGPDELYNIQEIQDEKKPVGTMIKSLVQNPIYVGLCLLSICEAFILSAFNSFMSKYVQNQFGLSTKGSSIIMGCLIVPAGFLGIISGGYFVKRYQLSTFQLLLLIQSCLSLSLLFSAGFILVNDPVKIAGINFPYWSDPAQRTTLLDRAKTRVQGSLISQCNAKCSCDASQYNPICGVDLVTYYNPCFAGCRSKGISADGINVFYKCSCISMNKSNGFIIEKDRRTLNFYRQLIESSVMNKLRDKVSRMENDTIRDERVLDISQDDIEEMLDAINPNLLKGSTDKNYLESNTDKNFLKPNTINNVLKPDNNFLEPNTDKAFLNPITNNIPKPNSNFLNLNTDKHILNPNINNILKPNNNFLGPNTDKELLKPSTNNILKPANDPLNPNTDTLHPNTNLLNPTTPSYPPLLIPTHSPRDRGNIFAYGKACPNTSTHVILFSISTFFAFYFMFLCIMPATESILRSVTFEYKSFALAIQWLLARTLAMLPSPTILALFIDSSCLYWRPGEHYCILYDNYYFSRNLATYAFYFRHLSIYIVMYMMFREYTRRPAEDIPEGS
ncbi:hypothetical protein M8J75_007523 [Diaphorina citri]|nr:hypothetical protein M8J75_007523 [Diaphorina citri]